MFKRDDTPYKVDFRISLVCNHCYVYSDGIALSDREVPKGLEGIVDFERFIRDFSLGAESVVFSVPNEPDIIYKRELDSVRDNQHIFLYIRS